MNNVKKLLPFFALFLTSVLFFNKTFTKGLVPFPGDLLVSEYQPFRSYSYLNYSPGGIPNKAQYFDVIREFYPWRTLVNQMIKQDELPLWNPYNFSGSPLLANYQTAVFYPLNLLYLILNQLDAWTLLVILQPLLASLFTYLYARKLGINMFGGLLSAIAFAYSSYMNVWLEFNTIGHTLLWLPLSLYAIEGFLEGKSKLKFVAILVFSLTFALFAGHPLDFGVIYLFAIFYTFARIVYLKKQVKLSSDNILAILPLLILPVLLGAIQLLPTFELLTNSTRAPFDFDFLVNNILIQPYQLIMIVIPDFFGNPATRNFWLKNSYVALTLSIGAAPLLFLNLVFQKFKQLSLYFNLHQINIIKFFALTALIILILTVKNPFSLLLYKINIPVISTNSPTKLLSVFLFCLSILAGFGANIYNKEKKVRVVLKSLLPFAIIFGLAFFYLKFIPQETARTALRNLLYSFSLFSISAGIMVFGKVVKSNKKNTYLKKLVLAFIIITTVFDLYYMFNKFNPFSPREFIFPKAKVIEFLKENAGINRFWGYGTAKVDSNLATQYQIFSTDGFDALNLSWYNQFISSSKDGKIKTKFSQVDRSVAEIVPGYGETDLVENKYRKRILDALGVKYILDRTENPKNDNTFSVSDYKKIWEDENGWIVYENLNAAPRYFLTTDIKTYTTNEEFEKIFFSENFSPKKTILLKKNDFDALALEREENKNEIESEVKLQKYSPNKMIFETQSSIDNFLFLSDTFDYEWEVYIDSNQSAIYLANYAFRAVFLPKGEHQVIFTYRPSIFKFVLKNAPKSH